jgi:serine protease Do
MHAASRDFHEEGYRMIGWCQFNAPSGKTGLAVQAEKVGAKMAIVQTSYSHTATGSVGVPVPTTSRSTSSHSGSVSSGGQYATYNATTTTTTRSMSMRYIPYSIDKYDYVATFWVKMKPPILGIMMAELDESTRTTYERNTGVYVDLVLNDTPAFAADLVPGDVIIGFNDEKVVDCPSLNQLLRQCAGEEVTLTVLRKSGERTLTVQLNNSPL